jgi:hypothetical protein
MTMSNRYEINAATETTFHLVTDPMEWDEIMGDEDPSDAQGNRVALMIGDPGDSAYVLVGTVAEIQSALYRATRTVTHSG